MPGFDGRGPMDGGPMTGGGRGSCNPAQAGYGPAYAGGSALGRGCGRGLGSRRGFRRGCGYGRGFGWRADNPAWGAHYVSAYGPQAVYPQDEVGMLKNEAEYMKQELDAINKRIEELEAKSAQA